MLLARKTAFPHCMFTLKNISIQFAGRILFEDLTVNIGPHDRIALAGPNGAGKSTLLKIIVGLQEPHSGEISQAKHTTTGYLPQDGISAEGRSLLEECKSAFGNVIETQKKVDYYGDLLEKLDPEEEAEEYGEALELFGEFQHQLEDLEPDRMQAKIERVLTGLGFQRTDLDRDCGEYSGGWQMRIALAKLLLSEPSVLLLDEPTNHLDIESQTWLESYLRNYEGAIVMVSHDRAFLDSLTTRTLAFRLGRVEEYKGNYSHYIKASAERRKQLEEAYKAQQREIAKIQEFIDRFRYKATKAKQVQSRIKQLEKIERIELERDESEIRFHFPQPKPSGQTVIELKNVKKAFDEKVVFNGFNLKIEKGERIAVVGVNGAGKSTLVRMLAGDDPPTAGERIVGHKVEISYFAQNQAEELDPTKTVIESVGGDSSAFGQTEARRLLGCFLFRGDDAFKHVKVLSGGERNRLALSKMLLKPANFLILDEPTNHLDMQSQDVLQHALQEYTGTIVVVSHNRAFLDPLVKKVLEISPEGNPRFYIGNVSEYIAKKQEEEQAAAGSGAGSSSNGDGKKPTLSSTHNERAAAAGNGSASTADGEKLSRKDQRRLKTQARNERNRRLKPLQEKLQAVEDEIEQLETRTGEIETEIAKPDVAGDADKVRELSQEYQQAKQRINALYSDWDKVSDDLERTEKQIEMELEGAV